MEMRTSSAEVAFAEHGEGRPVVLLHGAGGTGEIGDDEFRSYFAVQTCCAR